MLLRFRKSLIPGLSILGLSFLSFLLGAAVMFFELPPSAFLERAFVGAQAWQKQRRVLSGVANNQGKPRDLPPIRVDNRYPRRAYQGFTLCVYASTGCLSSQALLLNMNGDVVHRWGVLFSTVWPEHPHVLSPVDDLLACFMSAHLYPNGDLLAVFHGLAGEPPEGYGLVKLDKESKIVWRHTANIHHDVDVGEDGTIYALEHKMVQKMPAGLESLHVPALVDSLLILSPDTGELKKTIPILEAFRDSPYAALLASVGRWNGIDPTHANCVKVLTRDLAARFPMFKPGQVLISLREMDTIAVLDIEKSRVVWAAKGPWRRQHDAQFLDNGRILLFDNRGLSKRSRVLEYEPETGTIGWSYAGENRAAMYTSVRGMSQRLPNGNTLVVLSESGEILEVTSDKEVVWSASCQDCYAHFARRYSAAQLSFLKGDQHVRP